MKSRARNVIVGLVVLGSLIFLAVGIYRFGSAPAAFFKPPVINVTFESARGDGLGDGSTINYLGVEAGRVTDVMRDPATNKIVIKASLYQSPPVPANVYANIVFISPLGGVSSLDLRTDGPVTAGNNLQEGATLKAEYLGSTFIPPEFAEAARSIKKSVDTFNDSKLIDTMKQVVENTNAQITKAGETIDGLNKVIGDPKFQADLKDSIASVRKTASDAAVITERVKGLTDKLAGTLTKADNTVESAKTALDKTAQRIDEVGLALGDRLRQASSLLDNINDITKKINEGKGTAGALINDPKLYQGLVETTNKLNLALDDIKRYVNQVEQEGLYLKLK